jgi:hypothetical protein
MVYSTYLPQSLTALEWANLKNTAAFSKEAGVGETDQKQTQFYAKQLYEPTDSLRQLGLPVIDWGQHKWRASSDQGSWRSLLVYYKLISRQRKFCLNWV